jgi:oligopeptide transport system substrate-binding protein
VQSHKKFHASFLITFLALVPMLILSACGKGSPQTTGALKAAPASQQVYRVPIVAKDINTLDPGKATDLNSISAIDLVFTGLVSLNDQLDVQPQLASSWTVSPDGLTWTFKLKPNLKFSDGTSLTSADVAYSIDRALSPAIYNTTGISLTYLGLIKGATDRTSGAAASIIGTGILTPDPSTVVINVTTSTAYFLEALSYPTSYVVEKSVFDKWGDKVGDHLSEHNGQGGDGPFKVQSYDHNTGLVFVPNSHFENKQPQLQRIQFAFLKDANTSYLEYQTNQLDQSGVPSANIPLAKALPNKQYRQSPLLAIDYLGLNYLVKPFDNIKIREAMELALNKDVIAQSVWRGLVVPTNHIVPSGMFGYDAKLTGPAGVTVTSGDTAKAKQLFTEGMQEEGLTLATFPTIRFTYGNASADLANAITTEIGMWKEVLGITTIQPNAVDATTLFSDIGNTVNNTSLQMWSINWFADYPDPQDWISLQFDKGQSDNQINYGQNTSTDASDQVALQPQMEAADTDTNLTSREQTYFKIEQQLSNDVAWLPMDQPTNVYVLKPYVIGVIDNAQVLTPANDWANIYIAVH